MQKKVVILGFLFCLIGFGSLQASANLYNVSGSWSDVSGSYGATFKVKGNTLEWGGDDRDLTFRGAQSLSLAPGNPFSLGTLTFDNEKGGNNGIINASLKLSGLPAMDRPLSLAITVDNRDASAGTLDTLRLVLPEAYTFSLEGTQYSLSILGLSRDGGNSFVNSFSCQDNEKPSYQLYAQVNAVPIPPTAILMGSGLLGLLGLRRRA